MNLGVLRLKCARWWICDRVALLSEAVHGLDKSAGLLPLTLQGSNHNDRNRQMNQWHPVPAHMAAALSKQTWTTDNPAPDAVGYLWAWHMQHNQSAVSIRELAKWAGWKNWRARKVLQEMNEQIDAWEGKTTRIRTASAQPTHSERTVLAQHPDTNQIVTPEKRTVLAQPAHTFSTASAHSRASSSLKTKDTITIKEQNTADSEAPVERPKPVRGVFDEIVRLRLEALPGARELTLTKARAQILKARITEHSAEDVLEVVKWWLRSTHKRAGYLRENGHGIDTLLRASNFPKYLEFSQEQPRPKAAAFSVPPPAPRRATEPPALSLYSAGQVEAVKADLEGLQDACKPETWDRMVRTALAQSFGRAAK